MKKADELDLAAAELDELDLAAAELDELDRTTSSLHPPRASRAEC